MKKIAMILLAFPVLAFADVSTSQLTPVVKLYGDKIQMKDKSGNSYIVKTDCKVNFDNMTEFTVRSKRVKKGTPIKFSETKTCSVEQVTML